MITLKQVVFEKSVAIKNWIVNCEKNGTAILGCRTVEAFLRRYDVSESEFCDLIRNEYGFETTANDHHFIMSRTELRMIY